MNLMISTVTVKCPDSWEDEDYEAIAEPLELLIEGALLRLKDTIETTYPELTLEVSL